MTHDTYSEFKKESVADSSISLSDSANIFDQNSYDPKADTLEQYLATIGKVLEQDSSFIVNHEMNDSGVLALNIHKDSVDVRIDTFSNDIKHISTEEMKALKYNLEVAKQPKENFQGEDSISCNKKKCKVWVHVSKKKQRLFLYVDGIAVDTFKVSTGDKDHETPTFDTHPNGIMFQKYTSKKYPGGSYQGLGNMPYVVFIEGGYGLHGTTIGNFKKLGSKASHGCIRLHPNNAKLLFELVESVGANNTWITVSEK